MDKDIKFEYYLVPHLFERIVSLELRINELENKLSYSKKTTFDYKDSDNDAFKCFNGANTDNKGKQDIRILKDLHKKSLKDLHKKSESK